MSLKIAVTSPFSWPYIRRGNRCAHELATYLADRGHEVHFITSKPGRIRRNKMRGNVHEKYYRLLTHPFFYLINTEIWETFAWVCFLSLMKENYDIVQTTWPPDAFAASIVRSLKGTPFVNLCLDSNYFYRPTTFGKPMLNRFVKNASSMITISDYVNDELRRQLNLEGKMIPLGVDLEHFTLPADKSTEPPRILCTSSFLDPRKRVSLLVQAFELLLKEVPNAVLQLSGHGTMKQAIPWLSNLVSPETTKSIEILEVGERGGLPSLYRQSSITVIPSLREAFGLVILESLASGTPVVGTRSGAIPEILDNPETGILFEPEGGPEDLCKALISGLELAMNHQTITNCRQHAERYSWKEIGPLYEKHYMEVLDKMYSESRK